STMRRTAGSTSSSSRASSGSELIRPRPALSAPAAKRRATSFCGVAPSFRSKTLLTSFLHIDIAPCSDGTAPSGGHGETKTLAPSVQALVQQIGDVPWITGDFPRLDPLSLTSSRCCLARPCPKFRSRRALLLRNIFLLRRIY